MKTLQELSEKFESTRIVVNYSDKVLNVSLTFAGKDADGDPIKKREEIAGEFATEEDNLQLLSILEKMRTTQEEAKVKE